MTQNFPDVFSIYYPKRDSFPLFHGPLYEAKKAVSENKRRVFKTGRLLVSGIHNEYELRVSRRTLCWKLKAQSVTLQRSYPEKKGYCIITRGFSGHILSKSTFAKKHVWLRTAYFETGSTARPAVIFTPDGENGQIEMLELNRETHMYDRIRLYPCPVEPGTQYASVLDNKIGTPELYLATDRGDIGYFRREEDIALRGELLRKLQTGQVQAEPIWKKEPLFSRQWETEDKLDIGENYRYLGGSDENGQRHGQGRTEQQNGMTAYEGEYSHGKRDGKGVYYDEDGTFCYYGGWKNGKRSGIGITVKKDSGAIHVGNWDAGVLSGASTVFNEDGLLKNFGIVENGSLKGIKVRKMADGGYLVGNWDGDSLTGYGAAFDRKGCLLYCGGFKEGAWEGQGASFNQDGLIDYAGWWTNGICRLRIPM